jgi:hypothetical protein
MQLQPKLECDETVKEVFKSRGHEPIHTVVTTSLNVVTKSLNVVITSLKVVVTSLNVVVTSLNEF